MRVERFEVGAIDTNCYLIHNEETKELIVVDPGEAPELIFEHVEKNGLKPVAILLTHGHFDHITGVPTWIEKYPEIKVYAGENEREMLEDPDINMTHRWGSEGIILKDVNYLKDGEVFELIGKKIKVLETPGHTKGGVEYYFENEGKLFSGDSLFHMSIGRTDMPYGSHEMLVTSIKRKILCLPLDTIVYPGHGKATTIEYEKLYNPYVK